MNTKKWLIVTLVLTFALTFYYFTIKKCWAYFTTPSLTNTIVGKKKNHRIQVALLLDTSSSMNGLIEQARSQLWQILNQLARTEKNGQAPELEIALYEYGNTSRMTGMHQIRKISDFTTDMDAISEQLFALTTSGGEEYCGQVIDFSLKQLEWGSEDSDLRMIYIAGNEPFSQGPVSFKSSCQLAANRSISVNTIFCGQMSEGVNSGWQSGATVGKGSFMSIQHNEVTQYIETPFDSKINALNDQLNKTYIPFGQLGAQKQQSQIVQDANAASYSRTNAAERAAFKSSKSYKAESWDLVDAYKKDKKVLEKKNDLPADLQNLSPEEVEKRILEATSARINIQKEIRELDQKRRDFQSQARQDSTQNNLQNSILQSVEKQAKGKGYIIKE